MDVGVRIKDEELLTSMKAYKECTDKLWNYLKGDNDLFHKYLNHKDEQAPCQEEYQNFKSALLGGSLSYDRFLNNPNHN